MDGGVNWTSVPSGVAYALESLSFGDASHGTAVGWYGSIVHTSDGGATWSSQQSGVGVDLYSVSFSDANHGTAVGMEGVILNTTDGGFTWTKQQSHTDNRLAGVFFSDINTGTVVGDYGTILRTINNGATSIERMSDRLNAYPKRLSLSQNYPNPFNASTIISYSVPSTSFVSLQVFDMLGRQVSNLVSEELAVGHYSTLWNAGKMPSGIYVCRLTAGSVIDTKKLMLVR